MAPASEPGFVQLFATAAGMPLQWRLLSGNNRESGRSALHYPDEQAARAAVLQLKREIDLLEGSVHRTSANLWAWELAKADQVLVTSGRDYDRMIRCEQAMQAFLRRIRDAAIGQTVLLSGARRWESRGTIGQAGVPG